MERPVPHSMRQASTTVVLGLLVLASLIPSSAGESIAVATSAEQTGTRPPPYMPLSIEGRTALITGATSGIGEACAWRLAEAGARLVLIGRREERLERLAASLREAFPGLPDAHPIVLDVQDLAAITALPEALPAAYRDVDILINNAGLALGVSSVDENDMSDVMQMINTNVAAVIALTRAFVPRMKARGVGHLINIGSIAGHESYAGGSVYCATKHAIDAFTTAARHDLLATPVRVTVISPGMVNTEFSTVRLGDKVAADSVYADIEPLVAGDIADNVLYAATRPAHVQVADIVVLATNQAAAKTVARVGPTLGAPSSAEAP